VCDEGFDWADAVKFCSQTLNSLDAKQERGGTMKVNMGSSGEGKSATPDAL